MSGVEGTRTFSSIYEEFKLKDGDKDQRLRDKGDGLYVHEGLTDSVARKKQKRQDGAQHVWDAIEREYGSDVRKEVFRRINRKVKHNPGQQLFRSDLDLISDKLKGKTPLQELQSIKESSSTSSEEPPELDPPRETKPLIAKEGLTDVHVRQREIFSPESGLVGQITDVENGRQELQKMFGFKLTNDQIRGLAGIPDPYDFEISPCDDLPDTAIDAKVGPHAVTIKINDKTQSERFGFSELEVTVYLGESGKVNVYRESSRVRDDLKPPPPSGLGFCGLVRQIHMARALGVNVVHNESTRMEGAMNGYYTWARFGGDAPLIPRDKELHWEGRNYHKFIDALQNPETAFTEVEEHHRNEKFAFGLDKDVFVRVVGDLNKDPLSMQEVMATPEGRALWRTFGFTIPLTFDLTDNSWSVNTLKDYGKESCFFDLSDL